MPCSYCGSESHYLTKCPWRRARNAWVALPEGVRAMIVVAVIILGGWIMLPKPARAAEYTANNGDGDSVVASDQPCTNAAVLAHIAPVFHGKMMAARAKVDGRDYAACWIRDGDSVHLVYEDGDQGLVPLSDFARPASSRERSGSTT